MNSKNKTQYTYSCNHSMCHEQISEVNPGMQFSVPSSCTNSLVKPIKHTKTK